MANFHEELRKIIQELDKLIPKARHAAQEELARRLEAAQKTAINELASMSSPKPEQ